MKTVESFCLLTHEQSPWPWHHCSLRYHIGQTRQTLWFIEWTLVVTALKLSLCTFEVVSFLSAFETLGVSLKFVFSENICESVYGTLSQSSVCFFEQLTLATKHVIGNAKDVLTHLQWNRKSQILKQFEIKDFWIFPLCWFILLSVAFLFISLF